MNSYIRLPFYYKKDLTDLGSPYIFAAPNEKFEVVKAFDICNNWARFFINILVSAMNGEFSEELKNPRISKILSVIQGFSIEDGIYVIVSFKSRKQPLRLLRIRSWGMLTGVGGFKLSPEEAIEVQDDVLSTVINNLGSVLSKFKESISLKTRMNNFRSQTDSIKLDKDEYVLIMCDGHCFSKFVKNRYKLPFDQTFIRYMNTAAIETAKHLQGFIVAYVQSDEISFLLHRGDGSPFFDYRLNKMVSLVSSWVSAYFMAEVYKDLARTPASSSDISEMIENTVPVVFDGRAFNLPEENDAFAYLLWRQNDCVRNSKQQAAQTYLSHNQLNKKNTDEQIRLLKETKGIDWNDYNDGEKYGRLIYRETEKRITEDGEEYIRTIWPVHNVSRQFDDELRNLIRNETKNNFKDN